MTTQKKQVVRMVKRTVELPHKLPCGCGVKAIRRFMGDTNRCECGKVWRVDFVAALPEPKFKAGDPVRVRTLGEGGKMGVPYRGCTGTISIFRKPTAMTPKGTYVVSLNDSTPPGEVAGYAEDELETVEDPCAPKFKKGDPVKVKAGVDDRFRGWAGIVKRVGPLTGGQWIYTISFGSGGGSARKVFGESNLELVKGSA